MTPCSTSKANPPHSGLDRLCYKNGPFVSSGRQGTTQIEDCAVDGAVGTSEGGETIFLLHVLWDLEPAKRLYLPLGQAVPHEVRAPEHRDRGPSPLISVAMSIPHDIRPSQREAQHEQDFDKDFWADLCAEDGRNAPC